MVRTKHRIGGYRVIAPIGAGGFATVYRALDEATGQEVAIKVLAENHSLVADTRRRFVDEVGLLSTIDTPTIAKIYEVGETETGQPYMVLELADRGDLRRRLEEIRGSHQVLNRADLTMLAHHLNESLTTLHRAEIIHRDVSPGNILIRSRRAPGQQANARDGGITLLEPGERFLLADLGHAKDLIRASGFTAGGGTKGFASPEQRDDITVVDLRTDIFSATAIIEWAAHDGEFADDLESFFDVGLAAEPDDRFTSMTEWHAAFSAALAASGSAGAKGFLGLPGLGSFLDTVQTLPERFDRRVLAVAMTALALGAIAALGIIAQLSRDSGNDSAVDGRTSDFQSVAVSVTERRSSLLVTGGDGQTGATASGPVGLSTSDDEPTTGEQSTTASSGASTTVQTTTVTGAPSTTADTTTTTTPGSSTTGGGGSPEPRAEVSAPADGAVINGAIAIAGNATFPEAIGSVELAVMKLESRRYWNPDSEGFQEGLFKIKLPVTGEGHSGAWDYNIPDQRLSSGRYLIRVWARNPDGSGESRSTNVGFSVP